MRIDHEGENTQYAPSLIKSRSGCKGATSTSAPQCLRDGSGGWGYFLNNVILWLYILYSIYYIYCLLITFTCSPKAEFRMAQLNEIG